MTNRWRQVLRRRWTRAVIASVAIPAAGYQVALRAIPYPPAFAERPASAIYIEDRDHVPLATLVSEDDTLHCWVERDQVGPYLENAIVAVEDERFFRHGGIDWRSVLGAAAGDLRSLVGGGSIRRGASTITMQLQRLRDPHPRSLLNKIVQAFRADQIERLESKQKILLDYLNLAPFGGNLVGAAAASERYFGKPLAALSLSQAALLAGLPQSPNALRPDRHLARAIRRRDHVLERMRVCGFIDDAAYRDAVAERIDAGWLPLPQVDRKRPNLPLALGALPSLIGMGGEGAIGVTLDVQVQAKTLALLSDALDAVTTAGSRPAATAVVLDVDSAECLAAVSLGERSGLDLTRRVRSTGSVLKPFIFAAAYQARISAPRDLLEDTPASWVGYTPRNFDHQFRGQIDSGSALAQSRNLPAMRLLAQVGVGETTNLLTSLGMRIDQVHRPTGVTLAVGGAESSAWEIAQAYATLARGGEYRPAHLISTDAGVSRTVLTRPACLAVLQAISDPDRTRTVCPAAADLGAAWKTGTSSGSRDAWCAAVTPRRAVVVWLGNLDGWSDSAFTGVTAAAPVALKILCSVDPGGRSFDVVHDSHRPATPVIFQKHSTTITTPVNDQKFVLDPDVPIERQLVVCRAVSNQSSDGSIWWFIDNQFCDKRPVNDSLMWPPVGGKHTVTAVDAFGDSASVRFEVIGRR